MTSAQMKREPIGYLRPNIPEFGIPSYRGARYEALVPDTLDLQERAALGVHGLTGPTDPATEYEIYWVAYFLSRPPMMQHDWNDSIQPKFMEALPLLRIASGSDLNSEVDRAWMAMTLREIGEDGLAYIPLVGRPWGRLNAVWGVSDGDQFGYPFYNGRLLSTTGFTT